MDDPKLQMARRVAADHLRARNPEAVMVDNIRNGNCDGFFGVTIALAAIEECTERAARLIDELNEAGPYEAIGAAKRLRSGDHLKGPTA